MEKLDLTVVPHKHVFGQDKKRRGESKTLLVILITAIMMIVEIVAGVRFGSMALLADGLHMGSHAAALSVTAFAYYYARKHANDSRYSFGTGKVNALAGFSSAILLVLFAGVMALESFDRFLIPLDIVFNQAIMVAVIGLVVNAVSVFILGDKHNDTSHDVSHAHHHYGHYVHDHKNNDHNLRAAYLHVLADALTSLFAIFALLAGKYLNWVWMDPLMGIVGAILVARWSYGLLRSTAGILLDRQAPDHVIEHITEALQKPQGTRIEDLHVWSIGPGIYNLNVSIEAKNPVTPDQYKRLLPGDLGVVHATVEVATMDDSEFPH
jgi:cation diffusion facilitator family transporter